MQYLNLNDLEALACEKLPEPIFDFIAGGADDEVTLRANRSAFESIRILPRVLVDVSVIDTTTTVLGQRLPFPVMLAPVALHRLAHPEGERAVARAAAAAGTPMLLSTMSSTSIEDVAAAADGPRWFQLYCYTDKRVTESLVQRAEAAGCSALCLTVDVPRLGKRERDFRHPLQFPEGVMPANFVQESINIGSVPAQAGSSLAAMAGRLLDPSLTWDVIGWLKSVTSMPIVVKGVLSPDDARLAIDRGVAAIVVSNHGGRQLDTVPPPIEMLPEIVESVGGRVEVLVDGGVRRGTDVVKALSLGARAVLIGRPYIWGLAVDGEQGVKNVLDILRTEFELAMSLCGVTRVDQITSALVRQSQAPERSQPLLS